MCGIHPHLEMQRIIAQLDSIPIIHESTGGPPLEYSSADIDFVYQILGELRMLRQAACWSDTLAGMNSEAHAVKEHSRSVAA
jgi:hypothetical protein